MLNGRAVIAQRSRTANRRPLRRRDSEDRLAADALVLAARQPLVLALAHALGIRAHELELQRRRTGIEDENIHQVPSVSRAAAARARARASSGVSPYAET